MISGGYNNNSNNNRNGGSSNIASKLQKAGNSLKKSGQKAFGRLFKSFFGKSKKFTKIIVLIVFILFFLLIFTSSCTYLFSGEEDGKSQNYIDYNNYTAQDGETQLSPANASVKAYYTLVSKNKSVWQERINENGEKELILSSDSEAVSDYFKNDKKYYIQPDLLFVMNETIFGEDYVYPEAFLKPVNYNKDTYDLEPLVDEKGDICVMSKDPSSDKEFTSVADYGIGTVMTYHKETKTVTRRYIVNEEDVYDEATGKVKRVPLTTPKEYDSEVVSSQEYDVLDTVITFNSKETYEYADVYYKTGELTETKRYKETKIISAYETRANYSSCPPPQYFSTVEEAEAFCQANNYYLVKDMEGNPVTVSRSFDLYEYYSEDSGDYLSFVSFKQKNVEDLGYDYFNDYLFNFATYKPSVERTYDTFRNFSSSPSLNNLQYSVSSNGGEGVINGGTGFDAFYVGDNIETINRIYDGLIQWGYSEEQACAVIGNILKENGSLNTSTENSIGAFGLCQWYKSRRIKLQNFASSYNGVDESDLTSQIQFLCMELDTQNTYTYASLEWCQGPHRNELLHYQTTWETSSDVGELTEAMGMAWERFATPNDLRENPSTAEDIEIRKKYSEGAYEVLAGRTIEYEIEIVPCVSENNGNTLTQRVVANTSKMTAEDSAKFNEFYNAVDGIEDGTVNYVYYQNPIGIDDTTYILAQTNTYVNGTLLEEEELKSFEELTENNYFTDLEQKQRRIILGNNGEKAGAVMELGQLYIGNHGDFAWNTYGVNGDWCSMFVWSLFKETNMLYAIGDPNEVKVVDTVGYGLAHSYLQWAMLSPETRLVYCNPPDFNVGKAEAFNLEGYADGQYGDIVIFEWASGGYGGDYADHVGLIISYEGNGTYITLEGNTTSDSVVAICTRHITNGNDGIIAIVRPEYNVVPENSSNN